MRHIRSSIAHYCLACVACGEGGKWTLTPSMAFKCREGNWPHLFRVYDIWEQKYCDVHAILEDRQPVKIQCENSASVVVNCSEL
jgi:hypothetical protein